MELVRAYVTLGFKEHRNIQPKDVTRIVTRYLEGESIEKIAKEEAIRIKREGRPLPQDSSVPEGFERTGGMIVPKKPTPEFGFRYEGQGPDDTPNEHFIRLSKERWRTAFLFIGIILLAVNITVGICNIKGFEMPFPVGFIPLPFLIWTLMMGNKRTNQLANMKRKREEQELNRLKPRSYFR